MVDFMWSPTKTSCCLQSLGNRGTEASWLSPVKYLEAELFADDLERGFRVREQKRPRIGKEYGLQS